MRDFVLSLLSDLSFLTPKQAEMWSFWVSLALLAALAFVAYKAWSRVVVPLLTLLTRHTKTDWDDALLAPEVLRALGQLLPALIVNYYLPDIFSAETGTATFVWIRKLTSLYIVWAVWYLFVKFIKRLFNKLIKERHIAEHSTKGLVQMFIILISCFAVIVALSILMGRSLGAIIATLGASTAVLMLVFKDSILGLVAGVQLSANKMLKKGDWIIVDHSGANGEVQDVSLTTVKVRNWDESITTIPPYKLISESFQNYANMRDGGGRQVRRSINIDLNSVRFLTGEELQDLVDDGFIGADSKIKAGTPRSVNIRIFRHYLERMLSENENVRGDMRTMVRQLQPTGQGLPLELFFFVRQTEWVAFEAVQSDIFDEVYALVNRFQLRLYQQPAGADFRRD